MTGERYDGTHGAWKPAAPPPVTTDALAGYDDLVEVGRGGDSVVFRARDVALHRDVAIKVLLVDDEARAARFAREVEITVELGRQHPNIVTVLATGTMASGRPCLVMDYHDGGTLHDRLRSHGPLPVDEVIELGVVLADALAFAHERGILHRDVKPQNVLVLPTSWVLADFGIARMEGSEHTASVETFTYRHAAPQILDGMRPTASDDIWSLGSTLYTLIDGRPPFASDDPDDDSALAYLRRARTAPHRALDAPGSERIAPVIDRCLAKDVSERWASAADLRDALAALRHTTWEPGGAPPATPPVAADPEPPVADAPPPAPAPLALSVVAHTPAAAAEDAAPTGAVPAPAAPEPDRRESGDAGSAAATAPPRRRRPVLVLGIAALVAGTVLGVGGALLRGGADDAADEVTTDPVAPGGIPTVAPPVPTGDPQPEIPEDELEVLITAIGRSSEGITLEWTDPTGGEGSFVLHRSQPDPVVPLQRFGPGTTDAAVALTGAEAGRQCYFVTVHLPTGRLGASTPRCLRVGDD